MSSRITAGNDHRVRISERRTRGDETDGLSVVTHAVADLSEANLQQAFIYLPS
jgi:hypothetical protein